MGLHCTWLRAVRLCLHLTYAVCFLPGSYATVDAVALRRRLAAGYGRIVVVTDRAQALHFQHLFQVCGLCVCGDPAVPH